MRSQNVVTVSVVKMALDFANTIGRKNEYDRLRESLFALHE